MKLLLDTHIAYWMVFHPDELRPTERHALDDDSTELMVSAVSIWELRLKWNSFHRSGDRKGPSGPSEALQTFRELGLPVMPLEPEIAAAALAAPMRHTDPFDELLLVQAQELGMRLLTRDTRLLGHPLAYSPR